MKNLFAWKPLQGTVSSSHRWKLFGLWNLSYFDCSKKLNRTWITDNDRGNQCVKRDDSWGDATPTFGPFSLPPVESARTVSISFSNVPPFFTTYKDTRRKVSSRRNWGKRWYFRIYQRIKSGICERLARVFGAERHACIGIKMDQRKTLGDSWRRSWPWIYSGIIEFLGIWIFIKYKLCKVLWKSWNERTHH